MVEAGYLSGVEGLLVVQPPQVSSALWPALTSLACGGGLEACKCPGNTRSLTTSGLVS